MRDIIHEQWPEWKTCGSIGSGSYGSVYEIQRIVDDSLVHILGQEKAAVKVITYPRSSSEISEMIAEGYDRESIICSYRTKLQNIMNEYKLMRQMSGSSNIVNCDDFRYAMHSDGIGFDVFFKMELLTPLLKSLPAQIPESTVIRVGQDICKALRLCQKYNVIHRDIKPQNIFLSPNGDYKLGDFGIARVMAQTGSATMIGTYKYMAPEVYGSRPYDARADIYSLGLVLYWMLNYRRHPFMPLNAVKAVVSAEDESRVRRLSGEPIPAPACGSPELKRIVLKACAFDPQDRYQRAEEMLHDLEQLSITEVPAIPNNTIPHIITDASDATPVPGNNAWSASGANEGSAGAWERTDFRRETHAQTDPHQIYHASGTGTDFSGRVVEQWAAVSEDDGTAGIWDSSISAAGVHANAGRQAAAAQPVPTPAASPISAPDSSEDADRTLGIWNNIPASVQQQTQNVRSQSTAAEFGGQQAPETVTVHNFSAVQTPNQAAAKHTEPVVVAHRELSKKKKSTGLAVTLCFFPWTGIFGLHDLYLGNKKRGLIKLCTLNYFAFGWILDIILLIMGQYRNSDNTPL